MIYFNFNIIFYPNFILTPALKHFLIGFNDTELHIIILKYSLKLFPSVDFVCFLLFIYKIKLLKYTLSMTYLQVTQSSDLLR